MATTVTKTIKSSSGDYASLNAWEAGEQRDLVSADEIARALCYGMQDTTAVVVDGWTTDDTRYITIDNAVDHGGKWSTSSYRLIVSNSNCLTISEQYVRLRDIQVLLSATSAGYIAVRFVSIGASSDLLVNRCIIRATLSSGVGGVGISSDDSSASLKVRNTLIYDFDQGTSVALRATAGYVYAWNCTIVNCIYGLGQHDVATLSASNFGLSGCTYTSYGTVLTNYLSTTTPTFVDGAGDDFHLQRSDTTWRKQGGDYNVYFTGDIDQETRGSVWDIGADEYTGVTSAAPTTLAPTTLAPTTLAPTTLAPTTIPTTLAPTTIPTTLAPTTVPTTLAPTTLPTTVAPTTLTPTTVVPSVFFTEPLDEQREGQPAIPRVDEGDLDEQREGQPIVIVDEIGTLATTSPPTTLAPTTLPTTVAPTTIPTTLAPTTLAPTTIPTTSVPTTIPTTVAPTTLAPTTLAPTTVPTTLAPTTVAPTTLPTTVAPTTVAPTTIPTTLAPTTIPTTLAPTTLPTTLAPTTVAPTTIPTTLAPTTIPTTLAPTTVPTTLAPTTVPTTVVPTTLAPTTVPTTVVPTTVVPTTIPTTVVPTTVAPTTLPTTVAPTTVPTTLAPTTLPTTVVPTTVLPTTLAPTTPAPTTIAPTTLAPTTTLTTVAPTTIYVCQKAFDSEIIILVTDYSMITLSGSFDSEIEPALPTVSQVVAALNCESKINKEIYANGDICW